MLSCYSLSCSFIKYLFHIYRALLPVIYSDRDTLENKQFFSLRRNYVFVETTENQQANIQTSKSQANLFS